MLPRRDTHTPTHTMTHINTRTHTDIHTHLISVAPVVTALHIMKAKYDDHLIVYIGPSHDCDDCDRMHYNKQ